MFGSLDVGNRQQPFSYTQQVRGWSGEEEERIGMTTKEKHRLRERAQQRLALGKCAGCGRSPLVTKSSCAHCRDSTRAAAERRRERLKSAGICFECGQAPAAAGVLRCSPCTARAILRTRRAEIARKTAAERRGGK
jgi:hypothetical protein